MTILSFEVNPFRENTYVLINGSEALIFDPGFIDANEMNLLIQALDQHQAQPVAVLLTHAHLDHVFGIDMVYNKYQIPVYLHPDDFVFWNHYATMGEVYGFNLRPFGFQPEPLSPGIHSFAGVEFDVRFTPGHAPGHLAYYIASEKTVISGDALFHESIGRTDLQFGDFKTLEHSIQTQLYTLPDDTKVLSGHGKPTTIGHEKRHNGFVRG